jgi:Protein of unknwon function (DUF3310)
MAIFKNSMAHKVRAFLKLHPKAKAATVAKDLGIPVSVVHSTLWRDNRYGAPKRKYKTRDKDAWETVAVTSSNVTLDPAFFITMEEPKADMVNHPPHYKVGGIEVIDFIKAKLTPEEFRGYLKGNVLKYTSRAGHKDDAGQDIGKLVWYATKLQETHTT